MVKPKVDPDLDRMKEIFNGVDDLLSHVAQDIAETVPADVDLESGINVIYFPQLGFHIAVPIDGITGEAAYNGGEEDWTMMFSTENRIYFKDNRMHEMDEQLGDMYGHIRGMPYINKDEAMRLIDCCVAEKEIEIVHGLAQRVLEHEQMLCTASDILGELDRYDLLE